MHTTMKILKNHPALKSIEIKIWSRHSNKSKSNTNWKRCGINQYNKCISSNNEANNVGNGIPAKRSFSKYILHFDLDFAWSICSWQSTVYSSSQLIKRLVMLTLFQLHSIIKSHATCNIFVGKLRFCIFSSSEKFLPTNLYSIIIHRLHNWGLKTWNYKPVAQVLHLNAQGEMLKIRVNSYTS